jgi:CRP-like cAMP-binding protein
LLAALPDVEYLRLEPHFEHVALSSGECLVEPDVPITHVFFPTEGIVSVIAELSGDTSIEIAIIGNEGMINTTLLLEGLRASSPMRRSVVQIAGHAYRVRAEILLAEFERGGRLRHWLLRFTQALITQIAQIAVCSRHHAVEAQLSRWLMQRLDRLKSDEIYVTHKEIATLLGVRREGVTEAACDLQDAGLIRYSRGHVELLDRAGLRKKSCECLGVIQKEYARLLGVLAPDR